MGQLLWEMTDDNISRHGEYHLSGTVLTTIQAGPELGRTHLLHTCSLVWKARQDILLPLQEFDVPGLYWLVDWMEWIKVSNPILGLVRSYRYLQVKSLADDCMEQHRWGKCCDKIVKSCVTRQWKVVGEDCDKLCDTKYQCDKIVTTHQLVKCDM